MPCILIVGRHDDPHTEAVSSALTEMGSQVICFDTFRGDTVRFSVPGGQSVNGGSFSNGLHHVCSDDITAVWLRQKPVVPMAWWSPLQHDAARFVQTEWRTVIQTLQGFLPSAHWVNEPEAQRKINYKPAQLMLANRLGFRIPRTEITNDPDIVAEMLREHGKVIYKNFTGYIFSDQTGILTTLMTPEIVRDRPDSIRRAPGIYQEFIPKDFEVRVTSIGNLHFGARIVTPKGGDAAVDWRHAQFEDIFRPCSLPPNVETFIEQYLSEAGLRYGASDFIVSPDGEWFFLECNPAGQFLWIEHALHYPIAQALANELSGKPTIASTPIALSSGMRASI
jgi:glutathione synthase/RimK-type ligase-like ATP-grasp enzyme